MPPRTLPFIFAAALTLLLAGTRAGAALGVALQMQLGNPSNATANAADHNHYLIQRSVEAIDYDDNLGEANWVSWDLTASDVGSSGRSSFITDNTLPASFNAVTSADYTNSGFNRGHLCPSADRSANDADNELVFYMSNILPQTADNNQGPWASLETYCRTLAVSGHELLIIAGGSGYTGAFIPSGAAAIPGYVWKIVVVVPSGSGMAVSRIDSSTRVIAVKMPNVSGIRTDPWTQYLTSPMQIEADTGYTFFTALPVSLASVLAARVDGAPAPFITGLSPPFGGTGAQVVIAGSGFTGASSVAFAGAGAFFVVNSDTQITATVPLGAASGQVSVIAPGGLATSTGVFTVTAAGLPRLVISQVFGAGGNGGATYKFDFIEIYNAGSAAADLSTCAVQYASATGSAWQQTPLSGVLLPGHYCLVQEAQGIGGTLALPTPQIIGAISMSGSSGKVALTNTLTLLTGGNPLGNPALLDFVGYGAADSHEGAGAAPLLTSMTAALRANLGGTDTDDNAADFAATAPMPHNGAAMDAWRSLTFTAAELSNSAISGDLANPAGDGLNNLAKYAFNLDPHQPDAAGAVSHSIATVGSERILTLTHRKNHFAADLTYTYEVSFDLTTWTPLNAPPLGIVALDAQTDLVSVSVATPAPALYLRVRQSR